jgi:hypothetical protein
MFFPGFVMVTAQFMAALEPSTVRAFEDYLRAADKQMTARAMQEGAAQERTAGVFGNNVGMSAGRGMVHDWSAVTFVPGGRKEAAIAVLEDFSRHGSVYPEVVEGRTERREPGRVLGFHRLRKKKLLEVNLEVKYQLDVLPAAGGRYASRSAATEIVEIDDAGTKRERRLPPGHDHGFLWRLQTYWTLDETSEGLWMEVRSITLTRDVPAAVGWAVKPLVRDVPRQSLEAMLAATRRAVTEAR